jgi:hypothetical protein
MKLDDFTLTIVFLFFPGLVCALIVSRLTTHLERRPTDFIIPSLVYGIVIYVGYSWLATGMDATIPIPHINILASDSRRLVAQDPFVLTAATALGVILAFIIAAALNHKLLHRFARRIRATNKFGDKDVWSYVMNSDMIDWLVVRVPEQELYYLGRLVVFSEEEDTREFVLSDTTVYDNVTGEEKYDAGTLYFSFQRDGLILELPQRSAHDGQE